MSSLPTGTYRVRSKYSNTGRYSQWAALDPFVRVLVRIGYSIGIGGSCTRLHRPLIIFNGISNKECSDEGSVLYSHESTGNTSTYYSTSVPRYIDPNWLDGCMTWAAMTDRYVRTIGRTTGEEVVHRMPIDASCSTHALEDRTRGPYHTNIIGCKGMICRHRRRGKYLYVYASISYIVVKIWLC